MQNDNIIQATAIHKTYDTGRIQVHALRGVDITVQRGEMVAGFASCKAELIKWMFVFWAGTTVTVVGTMIALVKL